MAPGRRRDAPLSEKQSKNRYLFRSQGADLASRSPLTQSRLLLRHSPQSTLVGFRSFRRALPQGDSRSARPGRNTDGG